MWPEIKASIVERFPRQMLNGIVSPGKPGGWDPEAEGWKQCIDSLLNIRLLEDDWDGQGSPAPEAELVDSAIILAVLLRQQHVKPPALTVQDVQGCVNLHWEWPDGTTLDIDVMEPYRADVYLLAPDCPIEEWQLGREAIAA